MQLKLIENPDNTKSVLYKLARIVYAETLAKSLKITEAMSSMIYNIHIKYGKSFADIANDSILFESLNEKSLRHEYTARKETRWQEYKGTMVRIEILLGDKEVREMRLRLMQNASGTDVDADSRTILARVADYEMKRVCGRNAESIVMVYDEPSFEVMRPTSFFDYRIEAEGATMREYGFRCVYKK